MSKKYYHIITNFEEIGGAEQMLIRTINASRNNTQHCIISLMNVSDLMKNQLVKNVEFHSFNANNILGLFAAIFKLHRIVKTSQPDVIYSWMYHANFVAALSNFFSLVKTPLIWGVRHSLDDLKGEGISTKLAIYAGRFLKNIPDKTIYCAKRAMQQHLDFGYSPKNKSIYIPNGYKLEEAKVRVFDKNNLVIGAAGRFHDAKDYYTLFKAVAPILANHSNIKLSIAGREVNTANEVLKNYINELSINTVQVELLGQLNNMPKFYHSVDFFVLSSKTEGFPNVLAEAAGYGCITFSTDAGDAAVILNDDARLVAIGDAEALESLLVGYINKPTEELVEISKETSSFIRSTYAIDVISNKILSIGNKI
jgi:glycosyltransferase involved in cell wall biosynthesis